MSDKRYVFLSYGRKDVYGEETKAVEQDQQFSIVEKVYYQLERLQSTTGLTPWFDKRSLLPGDNFMPTIFGAIEQSDYMLLFIGKNSMASEWCEREWKHALANCVQIIPILLEGKWEDADVQAAYPLQIRRINDINPQMTDGTLDINHLQDKVVTAIGHKPPPLTIPYNAKDLPAHYIERPQYLDDLKKRLGVNDIDYKQRKNIVGITSHQETAALQGIGGIGKTTLALALCNDCEVRRVFDYIFWLEAGPQTTAEDVPNLMRMIGTHFGDSPDLYTDLQTARALVQRHLSNKRSLLVLDDVWAENLVDQFSWGGIDCCLVVTTRNKGLVDNPQAVTKLNADEGLRLLATLFDSLNPDTTQLTDDHKAIVTTLDGYTLAIAIAGKWLNKYKQKSAGEYLARLRSSESDLFKNLELSKTDKNANLELSLSLSYNDLDADDQKRFRALGMFASGSSVSLGALDALWGTSDGFIEAQRLVDVGLLDSLKGTSGDDRYSQHPLLWAYAHALLTQTDEVDNLFSHYADFYIQLANQFNELPPEGWSVLDDDLPDIQVVGDELVRRTDTGQQGDLERAIAFANNTVRYLALRRQMRRIVWTEMGLNAARSLKIVTADKADYLYSESLFLHELGAVWDHLGDKYKALEYFKDSLPIAQDLSDRQGEAATLSNIGEVWRKLNNPAMALKYFEMALAIVHAAKDRGSEATILNNISLVMEQLGKKREALRYCEQALFILREIGDRGREALALSNIGELWRKRHKLRKALKYFERALPILREVGYRSGEATVLNNMGLIWDELGRNVEAVKVFEQVLSIQLEVGNIEHEAITLRTIIVLYYNAGEHEKVLVSLKRLLDIYKQIDDLAGQAGINANLAQIYKKLGQTEIALAYMLEAITLLRKGKLSQDSEGVQLEYYEKLYQDWKSGNDSSPVMIPSLNDETAQILVEMSQMYREQGEVVLRATLRQMGMNKATIEQILMFVKGVDK